MSRRAVNLSYIPVLILALEVSMAMAVGAQPTKEVPSAAMVVVEGYLQKQADGADAKIGTPYAVLSFDVRAVRHFVSSSADDPTPWWTQRRFVFPIRKQGHDAGTVTVAQRAADSMYNAEDVGGYELAGMTTGETGLDEAVRAIGTVVGTSAIDVWLLPWGLMCVSCTMGDGRQVVIRLDCLDPMRSAAQLRDGKLNATPLESWSQDMKPRLSVASSSRRRSGGRTDVPPVEAQQVAEQYLRGAWVRTHGLAKPSDGHVSLSEPFVVWRLTELQALDFASSEEPDPTVFADDPTYRFPVRSANGCLGALFVRRNQSPLGEKWLEQEDEFYIAGYSFEGDWLDAAVAEASDATCVECLISVIHVPSAGIGTVLWFQPANIAVPIQVGVPLAGDLREVGEPLSVWSSQAKMRIRVAQEHSRF